MDNNDSLSRLLPGHGTQVLLKAIIHVGFSVLTIGPAQPLFLTQSVTFRICISQLHTELI